MLARASTCLGEFVAIFCICLNLSLGVSTENVRQHHIVASKPPNLKIADSVLRDIRKTQFGSLRSESNTQTTGFDLTEDEMKKFKIWHSGAIPYYIDVLSFSDKVLRDRIRWFLNEVNSVTSLNFVELPRPPADYENSRWVFFINRRGQLGCSDLSMHNFTLEGAQRVVLGYDCISNGGGFAEVVLALAGVPPQHNAPNRDEYIEIVHENIAPDKTYLFEKLNYNEWLFHKIKYDFESASHYHHHKFSVNGRATILTKSSYDTVSLGEHKGFSPSDILKINMLYNYIVKKTNNNAPACNKLFSRGRNYQKGQLNSNDDQLEPLVKPNKYLGLEGENYDDDVDNNYDADVDNNYDDIINSGESNIQYDNNEENDTDNNYSGIEETEKHSEQDNELTGLKDGLEGSEEHEMKKLKLVKNSMDFHVDPLSYLSDYRSNDDNYQRKGKRKG